jgi:hypothetical protein
MPEAGPHPTPVKAAEEAMLGIGLIGPKRWVNRITGSLPLWR